MTGKSDRSLWAVSQKTPCCLAARRKEIPAAAAVEREPRVLCRGSSLQPPMAVQTLPLQLLTAGGTPTLRVLPGGLQWPSFGYPQNEAGRGFLSEWFPKCGGPTPTVGWAPPGSFIQADPQLLGFVVWTSLEKKSSFWFPCTSVRALPRLPQPPTSRGHCWDRMGASPTLESLILLWRDGAASFGGHSLCLGGELCVGAWPARRTWLKISRLRICFPGISLRSWRFPLLPSWATRPKC